MDADAPPAPKSIMGVHRCLQQLGHTDLRCSEGGGISATEFEGVETVANGCALDWYRRCGAATHRKKGEEQEEVCLVAHLLGS